MATEPTEPWQRFATIRKSFDITGRWAHSVDIERSIYAYTRAAKSSEEYLDKARQILYNLRVNRLLHTIPPRHLVSKDNAELAENTVLQRLHEEQASRETYYADLLQARTDKALDRTASLLRCRACKSSDIMWEQKQTRGADEAMTIFLTCNSCKSRWKMS